MRLEQDDADDNVSGSRPFILDTFLRVALARVILVGALLELLADCSRKQVGEVAVCKLVTDI